MQHTVLFHLILPQSYLVRLGQELAKISDCRLFLYCFEGRVSGVFATDRFAGLHEVDRWAAFDDLLETLAIPASAVGLIQLQTLNEYEL